MNESQENTSIRIVIAGGPGFGKTSVVNGLENLGYKVFHEISRHVLDEEKAKDSDILPWKNHKAFNEALFNARVEQFKQGENINGVSFYDRGLPDSIGYCIANDEEIPSSFMEDAQKYRYFTKVFITPFWADIYKKDAQRWEEIDFAKKVNDSIEEAYRRCGYEVIELPKVSIGERITFILKEVGL